MSFDETTMQQLLDDASKKIIEDIKWSSDEDHSPNSEFSVELVNSLDLPILIRGSYNPLALTLSFVLILKGFGRIYALDLGKDHKNPGGLMIGRIHKHKWTNLNKDKWAYRPDDITEPVHNISGVWKQFCDEVRLVHSGAFYHPGPIQQELFD